MTLGEKIIQLRKDSGYKQNQLASLLGITATRLNYWEKDKRVPDNTMIANISKLFNVPSNFFLGIGIFEKWDLICENKEVVITSIANLISDIDFNYDNLSNDLSLFIITLDTLIEDIEINHNKVSVLFKSSTYMQKIQNTVTDATNKKNQLIDNYEKLNDRGKEKLLEYSDDLVSSKKYIKNNPETDKMNA